jgi:type I restriction enzyme S subunit
LEIDQLVSLTEKQLTKKKAIKQGTMQKLLTGKKRLPGFTGEWQNFNLMKHSKIKARIGWQGLKKSEYLDSGYALLVTGTDFDDGRVQWDSCHYVTRDRYDQDRNIQIQNNDILITKDGSLGKAALVQGLSKPATLNSGIFVIRPLQNAFDPVFVYHILSSFVFKDFLDKLSAGSTIIHLYQKDVGKFEFLLPPTIEEQKAIATVLSEMDADIAALEEKLTKYRQVKQGMMQQLLTGKIRLV